MKYKGYTAKVELDEEQGTLFGRVLGLRAVITFEAETVPRAIEEFRASVDSYLELCERIGQAPEKPYSGNFIVRIDPARHRELAIAAEQEGKSLNAMIDDLVGKALSNPGHAPGGRPAKAAEYPIDPSKGMKSDPSKGTPAATLARPRRREPQSKK